MKKLSLLILILFVAISLNSCGKSEQANANSAVSVGMTKVKQEQTAPLKSHDSSGFNQTYNFTLKNLEGQDVSYSDYAGKIVILDFWDTWCPPCKAEIPHFIEIQKEYQAKGVEMLGIAFGQEGVDAVRKFVKEQNVNYTNLLATEDVIRQFGGIKGIPTTFVMTPNGDIFKKYVGYTDKAVFVEAIEELLARG